MKRAIAVFMLLFVFTLSGCGAGGTADGGQQVRSESTAGASGADSAGKTSKTAAASAASAASTASTASVSAEASAQSGTDKQAGGAGLAWPVEFAAWGVPVIEDAEVTIADNRSATQTGMTQGVNAIVNLKKLPKADFDEYLKALSEAGFQEDAAVTLKDIMYTYKKSAEGGEIVIILSYSEDSTTISANNSAVAAEKDAAAGGSADWPKSLEGIPAFSKGRFKETVEMGGGMYAITFLDVSEADLDEYRAALEKAGFQRQDSEDTEGYAKFGTAMAYSVGFMLEDGTLQIIAMSQSY